MSFNSDLNRFISGDPTSLELVDDKVKSRLREEDEKLSFVLWDSSRFNN